MAQATSPRRRPVCQWHPHYTQAPGLPIGDRRPASQVKQAVRAEGVAFHHRLFSPLVTLWGFLSQALDPDQSCSFVFPQATTPLPA
jgi:hypothetical protein